MFGPTQIRTPNIDNDITAFFSLELGAKETKKIINSLSSGLKNKLYKITERFEFVEHLLTFRKELIKNKKFKLEFFNEPNALFGISKVDTIKMFNTKFDGVDYDIEALVLYLLLTCVDTLAGQDEYMTFSEWLEKQEVSFSEEIIDLNWIKAKEKEHKEMFGIGRNFKNLLTNGISNQLKKRMIENFAVTKLDNGGVNKDSWKSWELANDNEKLKKIATTLFEQIRNKYTHTSHRTFVPCVPIKYLRKTGYPVLLSLNGDDISGNLIFLLKDIVRYIVRDRILNIK